MRLTALTMQAKHADWTGTTPPYKCYIQQFETIRKAVLPRRWFHRKDFPPLPPPAGPLPPLSNMRDWAVGRLGPVMEAGGGAPDAPLVLEPCMLDGACVRIDVCMCVWMRDTVCF